MTAGDASNKSTQLLSRLESMNMPTALLGSIAVGFVYGIARSRFRVKRPYPDIFYAGVGGTMAWLGARKEEPLLVFFGSTMAAVNLLRWLVPVKPGTPARAVRQTPPQATRVVSTTNGHKPVKQLPQPVVEAPTQMQGYAAASQPASGAEPSLQTQDVINGLQAVATFSKVFS